MRSSRNHQPVTKLPWVLSMSMYSNWSATKVIQNSNWPQSNLLGHFHLWYSNTCQYIISSNKKKRKKKTPASCPCAPSLLSAFASLVWALRPAQRSHGWISQKRSIRKHKKLSKCPHPRRLYNMEPENTPLEKKNHLPNHHFQTLC